MGDKFVKLVWNQENAKNFKLKHLRIKLLHWSIQLDI